MRPRTRGGPHPRCQPSPNQVQIGYYIGKSSINLTPLLTKWRHFSNTTLIISDNMDVAAIIKYFSLNEHPFMTSPDPRFLYFSSQVKEALAKCEFMARDRIGPLYMYGPIGSGKTSLVRRLAEKLGQDERYNVKLLISPNLNSRSPTARSI